MTLGTITVILIALATLAWVVLPLLRGDRVEGDTQSAALSHARELQSRHQQLLASLRDLEDDRATDKIDQSDYDGLRARLSSEAIEVMRELDTLKEARDATAEASRKAAEPLQYPGPHRPDSGT
jgi:hypothetical protein